jgi:hypothetical protein
MRILNMGCGVAALIMTLHFPIGSTIFSITTPILRLGLSPFGQVFRGPSSWALSPCLEDVYCCGVAADELGGLVELARCIASWEFVGRGRVSAGKSPLRRPPRGVVRDASHTRANDIGGEGRSDSSRRWRGSGWEQEPGPAGPGEPSSSVKWQERPHTLSEFRAPPPSEQ